MENRNLRNLLPPVVKPLRIPIWAATYAILVPVLRVADKTGLLVKIAKRSGSRMNMQEMKKNSFEGYEPVDSDIVVYAYAKSGTNWMMQIAHQIATHGQGEYGHIHDVVPWPDKPVRKMALPLSDPGPRLASPTGLRVIKTHLDRRYVPINDRARYIAVIRDPKDVFVSSYFFAKSVVMGPLMPSVQTWLEMTLSDASFFGRWAENTDGYWRERGRRNVMVLTFEEMKKDLAGAIERITGFLGVDLTPEAFEAVCKKSSFAYMRSIDHKFYPGLISPWTSPEGKMMRKGKSGASDEILTVAQQERIDRYYLAQLQKLNSTFPYEARYMR